MIDVTRLYTTNVPEFASSRGFVDERRSYIEKAVAFPENVEVKRRRRQLLRQLRGPRRSRLHAGLFRAQSVVAHWSMVHLPDRPMMPRLLRRPRRLLLDRGRSISARGASLRAAAVHRAVPAGEEGPVGELSEPVKPIVYYVDPATPKKWILT